MNLFALGTNTATEKTEISLAYSLGMLKLTPGIYPSGASTMNIAHAKLRHGVDVQKKL
jgi:hypothetical protein